MQNPSSPSYHAPYGGGCGTARCTILQACVLVRLSTSTAYRLGMMSYVVCCLGESILPAVFHFQKALK